MTEHLDQFQAAEVEDGLGACYELHTVMARLKRLGLLSDDENHLTSTHLDGIMTVLEAKIPADETATP